MLTERGGLSDLQQPPPVSKDLQGPCICISRGRLGLVHACSSFRSGLELLGPVADGWHNLQCEALASQSYRLTRGRSSGSRTLEAWHWQGLLNTNSATFSKKAGGGPPRLIATTQAGCRERDVLNLVPSPQLSSLVALASAAG